VPERVWAELVKALAEAAPARFFEVLHGCGALEKLFPGMLPLAGARTPGGHTRARITLPVLEAAGPLSDSTCIRFAAWVCDMDNATADGLGTAGLDALCQGLRTPNACRELAAMALRYRKPLHAAAGLSAQGLLELLESLDAFRRRERVDDGKSDGCARHIGKGNWHPVASAADRRDPASAGTVGYACQR
jgi:tRNA nucleotidyltransferase (CCA-adding enzyme)